MNAINPLERATLAALQTDTQDEEDAAWKANHIAAMLAKHKLNIKSVGDMASGSGGVMRALAKHASLKDVQFTGYDGDLLERANQPSFDALLVLDYFEHVPDYLGLLAGCKRSATYKIFHIPLEICMLSVLRDACVRNRYSLGHIHYFTAESALACLKDSGHEIVDYHFTDSAGYYQELHPSLKKKIANLPRSLVAGINQSLAAKVFGGYSLLVLTK